MVSETGYLPTHLVPEGGLPAWDQPDPGRPPVAQLDPRLPVQLLRTWDAWAEVLASNGWTGWVDGRLLVASRPGLSTTAGAVVRPLALTGVALAVVGTFLPWFSAGGESLSGWDVPLRFLVAGTGGDGVKAGPFLLLTAVAVLPMLAPRSFPDWLVVAGGAVAGNAATLALGRVLSADLELDVGVGVPMTLAGAALLAVEFFRLRVERRRAPR